MDLGPPERGTVQPVPQHRLVKEVRERLNVHVQLLTCMDPGGVLGAVRAHRAMSPVGALHNLGLGASGDSGHRFERLDRKSTRLNSSHVSISYAVFCLKKKKIHMT